MRPFLTHDFNERPISFCLYFNQSKVDMNNEEVILTFEDVGKLVSALCGIGVGIGIGYGIWYDSGPIKATADPQKPGDKTTTGPKVTSIKPEVTGSVTDNPTTQSTPGKPWLDTPCFTERPPQCPDGVDRPPLILVSLDGFRYDFLQRGITPNIKRLSECGTHAPHMYPAFPTLTFPNHYSIVTGLLPEHHGLIGNSMYDPVLKKSFSISGNEKFNSYWYGGEPVWNTAMKQGLTTGCYFWVGSDVEIQGMRPDYYFVYDGSTKPETKINQIKEWLKLPNDRRPDFITLYFDEPDHTGHDYGPDSNEQNEAVAMVDSYIGDLMDAITEVHMENCTNIIVLADHGMANRSCELNIKLQDYITTGDYYSRSSGGTMMRYDPKSYAAISEPEDIVQHLKCISPGSVAYIKTDTPKRWHYMNNVRIEDTLIAVKQGYTISNGPSGGCDGGGHGYDNLKADQMRALFVAYGPVFKANYETEPFHNVELMNLMCDVLSITPPPNDGEVGSLHHLLFEPPNLPPKNDSSLSSPLVCPFPTSDQDYADRINEDTSMCMCETLPDGTTKTIEDFDKHLNLTESQQSAAKAKHVPFGMPEVNFLTDFCELVQTEYVTAYSHEMKMSLYATFTMDKKTSRDTAPVFSNCTRPDVRIPNAKSPDCSDLDNATGDWANITKGFLYSPGLTETLTAKMDALISSNMVPQFRGFIKDLWSGFFDVHFPIWADEYNGINVITGPIFDHNYDGLRDSLELLSQTPSAQLNDTFVPTHFFIVINRCVDDGKAVDDADCDKLEPLSFILQNKDGIQTCQMTPDFLETHVASVKDIELLTGLRFYPDLERYESIRLRTFSVAANQLFSDWRLQSSM
ncbi:venom phosphodiesterase 2-like isoform X2 [Acanthaster planci]|uniref:Venom phosphodiesterase 2-like isoform X2 n=1 Tax=Acanthaster planci TaxID=133434 RepID=A0A8B7ZAD1_ACAPL|nr:venom phosphodiesterase 2-like isoform X2 [Acanthaster planci]